MTAMMRKILPSVRGEAGEGEGGGQKETDFDPLKIVYTNFSGVCKMT